MSAGCTVVAAQDFEAKLVDRHARSRAAGRRRRLGDVRGGQLRGRRCATAAGATVHREVIRAEVGV